MEDAKLAGYGLLFRVDSMLKCSINILLLQVLGPRLQSLFKVTFTLRCDIFEGRVLHFMLNVFMKSLVSEPVADILTQFNTKLDRKMIIKS